MNFLLFLSSLLFTSPIDSLQTPFEKSGGTQSATYEECISYYEKLAALSPEIKIIQQGNSSVGKPYHLIIISRAGISKPTEVNRKEKAVLFINNGIHPGEPDGIDASMMLARDLLFKKEMNALLSHVVVLIIPVYNIAGCMNRGCCSRANQNGPLEYGFRANAQNLDLNRDFMKNDAPETFSFENIFTQWHPDWFADTHVSDGADYTYTMTYIATQHNKLSPKLADYETNTLVPYLKSEMSKSGYEMCPYVNTLKETPDSGIAEFLESPRFSTGYAALFNCIGFVLETHMLKPYDSRVRSTYAFLLSWIQKAYIDHGVIHGLHEFADEKTSAFENDFPINYKLDMNSQTEISFKGYEAKYKPSDVSGESRLYYDEQSPYNKKIPFYNTYTAQLTIPKPSAYIIPQHCKKVIDIFQNNGVQMQQLTHDTIMKVECYYILDYKTGDHPYEGHYLHNNISVQKDTLMIHFYAGDVLVKMNQPANRFILECLEPQSMDGFFAWNYFDAILQQKEGYNNYVWEDKAAQILSTNSELKKLFEEEKKSNPDFAKDADAQLDFIYRHSPDYETSVNRYPVCRVF